MLVIYLNKHSTTRHITKENRTLIRSALAEKKKKKLQGTLCLFNLFDTKGACQITLSPFCHLQTEITPIVSGRGAIRIGQATG